MTVKKTKGLPDMPTWNQEEFVVAIAKLQGAAMDLQELWAKMDPSAPFLGMNGYPFDKPFDKIIFSIALWAMTQHQIGEGDKVKITYTTAKRATAAKKAWITIRAKAKRATVEAADAVALRAQFNLQAEYDAMLDTMYASTM